MILDTPYIDWNRIPIIRITLFNGYNGPISKYLFLSTYTYRSNNSLDYSQKYLYYSFYNGVILDTPYIDWNRIPIIRITLFNGYNGPISKYLFLS